jgi:glycerol dehydrogenase
MANPAAGSSIGGRPTIAATAIADACARALYEHGPAALAAVRAGRVDAFLEDVVEANTLLSGIGFESGGLALAHGVAQSCSAVEVVHANHLHGEMVAFGLMAQLAMENDAAEADRVAAFLCEVGLPVTLRQLSIDPEDTVALDLIAAGTIAFPTTSNMPLEVDEEMVLAALRAADKRGRRISAEVGDAAYRRLHVA